MGLFDKETPNWGPEYVTLIDTDIGREVAGGGKNLAVEKGQTLEQALTRAAAIGTSKPVSKLRIVVHGVFEQPNPYFSYQAGFSLGGKQYNLETGILDWLPIRGIFDGIVVTACGLAATPTLAQDTGSKYDGEGFCKAIAVTTNTVLFASSNSQPYGETGTPRIYLKPWVGRVWMFGADGTKVKIQ